MQIVPQQSIDAIRHELESLAGIDIEGTAIEVEARYGYFTSTNTQDEYYFTSGVSQRTFSRMRKSLPNAIYSHSIDRVYYDNKDNNWSYDSTARERYTTILDANGIPQDVHRLVKSKIRDFDIHNYGIRIAISKETLDRPQVPPVRPIYTREKKRWSYRLDNGRYRLDITEVTTIWDTDEIRNREKTNTRIVARQDRTRATTVYEVELEVEQPRLDNLAAVNERGMSRFAIQIQEVLKALQGTLIIYDHDTRAAVFEDLNISLGPSPVDARPVDTSMEMDVSKVIQPRNLKVRDLKMGEIVPTSNRSIKYTVTIKADGLRKLFYIHTSGVYLVYGDQLTKISNAKFTGWYGTIFEAEDMPKNKIDPAAELKYRQAPLYILLRDCLSVPYQELSSGRMIQRNVNHGDGSIRNVSLFDRLETVDRFLTLLEKARNDGKGWRFIIEKKEFNSFRTVGEFYEKVNYTLDKFYPFLTDGLIFTPDNYQHDNTVNTMNLSDRILSSKPDVMKWKPISQLTIDFAIYHAQTDEGTYIGLYTGSKKNPQPFSGTPFNPLTDVLITPELQNIPNGTIGEFKWTKDGTHGKFELVETRPDKEYPNATRIALDVWEDIQRPLDEELLRGQKFGLSFRYHNRVKEQLFNTVGAGLPQGRRKLLDIGSGKGGDIRKWIDAGFTLIFCVEPNESNRIELIRRFETTNNKRKNRGLDPIEYYVIPTTGQDWEVIVKQVRSVSPDGVNAISFMLSLSFFFDDIKSLQIIAGIIHYTLKADGYFLALTIDGRYVLDYFKDRANFTEVNGTYKSNMEMIDFELRPPNAKINTHHVYINIPDSIVIEQEEYLTNIPSLKTILESQGLRNVREWRTENETFMTQEELQYSGLFTALVMKRH